MRGLVPVRVYLEPPPVASKSLQRVANALRHYGPKDLEVVKSPNSAPLVVFHVIGRWEKVLEAAENVRRRGSRYAVVQYALRSTQQTDSLKWLPLWRGAEAVWSYYDLYDLLLQDGLALEEAEGAFNFYHAPLGVDTSVFFRKAWGPHHVVLTSGQSRLTESVRECVLAARSVGGTVAHLGPSLRYKDVTCYQDLEDEEVAALYNACDYVSGLRRIEGFELPAAEGLLCGARPILFDRPHYRRWYDRWGVFIPEGDRAAVLASLKELFAGPPPQAVTDEEWMDAAALFNWPRLVGDFWRRCGA